MLEEAIALAPQVARWVAKDIRRLGEEPLGYTLSVLMDIMPAYRPELGGLPSFLATRVRYSAMRTAAKRQHRVDLLKEHATKAGQSASSAETAVGNEVEPSEAAERNELLATVPRVMSLLAQLPERQRLAITLRFGLGGEPPMSMQSVGVRMGVLRSGADHHVSKGLRNLRQMLEESTHGCS